MRAALTLRTILLAALAWLPPGPVAADPACPLHDWLVHVFVAGETLGRSGPGLIRLDDAASLARAVDSAEPGRLARVMGKAGIADGLPVVSDYVGLVERRLRPAAMEPRLDAPPPEATAQRMEGYLSDLRCRTDPAWRADLTLRGPALPGSGLGPLAGGGTPQGGSQEDSSGSGTSMAAASDAGEAGAADSPPDGAEAPPAPPSSGGAGDGIAHNTAGLQERPVFSPEALGQGQLGTLLPAMPPKVGMAGIGSAAGLALAMGLGTAIAVLRRLRQRQPRHACQMHVRLRLPEGMQPAVAVDISPSGTKLSLVAEPQPGQRGLLDLGGLEVPCRVVWATHHFVGLSFLHQIEPSDFARLLKEHQWEARAAGPHAIAPR